MEDYTIYHVGEGQFKLTDQSGESKQAGENLCGIVRYTYFEDYNLPEIGWNVTYRKLMEDYLPKMNQDVLSGKLKPNQMNY